MIFYFFTGWDSPSSCNIKSEYNRMVPVLWEFQIGAFSVWTRSLSRLSKETVRSVPQVSTSKHWRSECFCHCLQLFASPHQYSHADSCLDTELLLNHSTVNSTEQCMFFETNPYRRHVTKLTKLLSQKYGKIVFIMWTPINKLFTHSTLQKFWGQ